MISQVAAALVEHLEKPGTPCLFAVASAARDLSGVGGFEPPSWRELVMGARPEPRRTRNNQSWMGTRGGVAC